MNLKIDPKFRDKIPPLTEDEFAQLERNILADGEVLEPLVVWNDTIIDGHHRWAIIQKHPEIPYTVKKMEFANQWAAIVWMCRNQKGRRNMTDVQLTKLLQEEYDAQKMLIPNPTGENQYSELKGPKGQQPKTARQQVAEAHGVGEKTVRNAISFGRGLDAADEVPPGFKAEILTGAVKAPKSTIAQIAKIPEPDRKKAVEEIKAGTFKPPTPPKQRKEVDLTEKYFPSSREFKTTIQDVDHSIRVNFEEYLRTLKNEIDIRYDIIHETIDTEIIIIAALSEAEAAHCKTAYPEE